MRLIWYYPFVKKKDLYEVEFLMGKELSLTGTDLDVKDYMEVLSLYNKVGEYNLARSNNG